MTTDDEGQGQMTCLGRFAGALPLDMRLSMLIHYGIALGESLFSTVPSTYVFLFFRFSFLPLSLCSFLDSITPTFFHSS